MNAGTQKPIYEAAPEFEVREDTKAYPSSLLVEFDEGTLTPSLHGDGLALDTWEHGGEAFATIAIRCQRGMALHIGHSAADLRSLAVHCLRTADELDGGKPKQ